MSSFHLDLSMLRALLALALVMAGCDPASPDPDGGPTAQDGAGPEDAGLPGPTVEATSPADGATNVEPGTPIQILFSEPMSTTTGTLAAATDEGAVALGARSWNDDATVLEVSPEAAWPSGREITITVGTTFESADARPLAQSESFSFVVGDGAPPRIVSTAPAEGATVGADVTELVITLSEAILTAGASLSIEGPGEPALGIPTFGGTEIRVPVSGLEHESAYVVRFEGWRDAAGNLLDASALGDEGALDFSVGPDDVAPVVTDSSPAEGQAEVDTAVTTRIAILFSEPMDPSTGAATLTTGGETHTLAQRWELGDTRLVLTVTDLLARGGAHRVALTGYTDLAGNPLDTTHYLLDGALDFTTGEGARPYVSYSTPGEGRTDAPPDAEIVIVFSEAMDTSRTTATIVGDDRSVEVSGTWSMSRSTLRLDVSSAINGGKTYSIDLSAFADASGATLDAAHPYLGDGVLDFTVAPPGGERCRDALTQTEGMALADGHRWIVRSGITNDGSASCDPNGHGADAVVRYRKTTPSTSSPGGRALHVTVVPNLADVVVEVRRDVCDPLAGTEPTLRCQHRGVLESSVRTADLWLDVGPGDYYVWVAPEAPTDAFRGFTVTVQEAASPPEGESCSSVLTTASALHTVDPSGAHQWGIPADAVESLDRAVTHSGPGALSCDPTMSMGIDAVVAYEKTSPTSLVTVDVLPGDPTPGLAVEVSDTCDPLAAGRNELACRRAGDFMRAPTITLGGPARTLYTWMSTPFTGTTFPPFSGATVRIDEFEPGPGDTCALAIPITAGASIPITADRVHRADAPSCMASGGVTWFKYTTSQRLGIVRTTVETTAAVVRAADGAELRCGDNAGNGAAVLAPVGTEICIALSSSATPTDLQIEEIPFDGVLGQRTNLDITAPGSTSASSRWLLATPTTLIAASSSSTSSNPMNLLRAPLAGGVSFLAGPSPLTTGLTATTFGNGGVIAGDGTIVTLSTSATASAARLFRIAGTDGTPLTSAQAFDMPPAGGYAAARIDALAFDGTSILAATSSGTSTTSTNPVSFYAIPAGGGAAARIGGNDAIHDVSGLAADATFLYLAGRSGTSEGIYRLRRADLMDSTQAPVLLASGENLPNDRTGIAVDSTAGARVLYYRTDGSSDVWMIVDPHLDTPTWAGRILGDGGGSGFGLAYDPAGRSLYLLDGSTWLRVD